MAEDAGQAYVGIVPSLKGFSAKLKAELAAELKGIDAPVEQAGKRAGGAYGDNLKEGIRSRLGGIATMLKTGLVAGTAAVVAGLGALTLFGLKSAASLEQTNIGIEALVGNAQDAKKFVGELQKFAATTPFEFAGVADASRRILAFGQSVGIARDEVIPTLTTIGDLVSVLGGTQENVNSVIRALGQMASKGKVSQEEILQLAEALPGFNANAAIASALGMSVSDTLSLITAGGVDATTGINALLAGMAKFPGAAGAMEKQSQTLLGVFSTFKDTMSIALTTAFQPVIPAIKQTLTDLTPVVGGALDQLSPAIGGVLTAALPLIGQAIQAIVPIITPALELVSGLLTSLGESGALKELGDAFGALLQPLVPLGPVIGKLAGQLINALVPIIVKLADSGIIETVVDALIDLLPSIVDLVPPLVDLVIAFQPLTDLLLAIGVPLLQLTTLLVSLLASKAVVPLIQALATAIGWMLKPFEALVPLVGQFVDWVKNIDWGAVGKAIGGWFKDAWNTVSGFFSDAWQWLEDLPGKIGGYFKDAGTWLVESGKDVVRGLWDGISGMGGWLWNKITGFISSNVTGPVKSLLGIHSPSTVFAGFGEDSVAGYAKGVEDSAKSASVATTTALAPAVPNAQATVAPAPQVVALRANDALTAALIDLIRDQVSNAYGNDVTFALQRS